MSPSNQLDDFSQSNWRSLGFYHYCDEKKNSWCFLADKKGLMGLAIVLREYVKDPAHDSLSEHEHFGPYMDFEVMTWNEPQITSHAVSGSLQDLLKLADLIEARLSGAKAGDIIIIDKDYSVTNEAKIQLEVKEDGFDPSSVEAIPAQK